MKIVIAVLAVMPLLAHAAPAAARDASRPPLINRPQPNPPCGDYWDDCGEKGRRDQYLLNLKAKAAGMSAAIADGKLDKAEENLDGLFAGAVSKEKGSESSAVAAGDWTLEPRIDSGLTKIHRAPRAGRMPLLVEREDGRNEARIVKVGAGRDTAINLGATIIAEGAKAASDAATKYAERDQTKESIEKYGGCRLRGTCSK